MEKQNQKKRFALLFRTLGWGDAGHLELQDAPGAAGFAGASVVSGTTVRPIEMSITLCWGGGWFLIVMTAWEQPVVSRCSGNKLLPLTRVNTELACQVQLQKQSGVTLCNTASHKLANWYWWRSPSVWDRNGATQLAAAGCNAHLTWRNCWSFAIETKKKKKKKKRITDSFASTS